MEPASQYGRGIAGFIGEFIEVDYRILAGMLVLLLILSVLNLVRNPTR